MFCQVSPMIFDSVLWFVSTSVDTCRDLMKDERKRMKALGGRGMWSSALFFPCPGFRDAVPSVADGKSEGGDSVLSTRGSSVNVPGVTAGAKAICCGAVRDSTVSVHVSWTPGSKIRVGTAMKGRRGPLTVYVLLLFLKRSRSLNWHVRRSMNREGKISRKSITEEG